MNKPGQAIGILILLIFFSYLLFYGSKEIIGYLQTLQFTPVNESESDRVFREYMANENLFPPNYDTILVQSKTETEFLTKQTKATQREAFSFMKQNSKKINEGFCYLNELDLYNVILEFNAHPKIPLPVYLNLFPEEEAENYFDFETNNDGQNQNVVTRKFERCYGFNDLIGHQQLIVVGKGDQFPSVHLMTYSNKNLELVSEKIIYKMENNGKEVFRIKSCLSNNFKNLSECKITVDINNSNAVDSIKSNYLIDTNGRIILE